MSWHDIVNRRPVFTVDYWPGTPGVLRYGQRDMAADIEHFTAYADRVTVRSLQAGYTSDNIRDRSRRGWITVPDVLSMSDAQLERWQRRTRRELEPFLRQYRAAGLQLLCLQVLMLVSGHDTAPAWYKRHVPDWAECDYEGTPLGEAGAAAGMVSLFHPQCRRTLERTFKALSFLKDEPAFLGFHVENEPHLGTWRPLETAGGNPHTRRAFRTFVQGVYPNIGRLNRIAGTGYRRFADVDIADDNWLIQTMAARFRSTWVLGAYQEMAVRSARKHLPDCVAMSRLEVGFWLNEYHEGREVCGIDFALLADTSLDVVSWSHLWDPSDRRGQSGIGEMNVAGGLLRASGKAIGFTEPNVQRYGSGQWSVFRPDELMHVIYRGLHLNYRMFNLHSWDREGAWAIYNEPFGAVHSKRPGLLRMVARLRTELDRSRPFETFGRPLQPPLGILVSRNARHYPGMHGFCYGNLLAMLGFVLETPRFSQYEVIEEQTRDVTRAIRGCRGLVVSEACLDPRTRRTLGRFVSAGGKLLIFGAPSTVGGDYTPAKMPEAFGVPARTGQIAAAHRPPRRCRIRRRHAVLRGLQSLTLQRPGDVVFAANAQVAYIDGVPTDVEQLRTLMDNFRSWCGLAEPQVLVSQFEHATIVQNWDTSKHRRDGSLLDDRPWTGHVVVEGSHRGGFREMREDHLWLAYHREKGRTVLEAVQCAPKDVKVFRKERIRERPHVEGLPDTLGFSYFWDGEKHPVIGRFTARSTAHVKARIVGIERARWLVCVVGGRTVAEGRGRTMKFTVRPGRAYYLVVSDAARSGRATADRMVDPVLSDHAFE